MLLIEVSFNVKNKEQIANFFKKRIIRELNAFGDMWFYVSCKKTCIPSAFCAAKFLIFRARQSFCHRDESRYATNIYAARENPAWKGRRNGTNRANAHGSFRRVAPGERKLESRKNAKSASSSGRWNRDRKRQRQANRTEGETRFARIGKLLLPELRFFFAHTTLVYHASEWPFFEVISRRSSRFPAC